MIETFLMKKRRYKYCYIFKQNNIIQSPNNYFVKRPEVNKIIYI